MSSEDGAGPGQPLEATLLDMVYSDRRIRVEEIAKAIYISNSSVSII